MEKENKNLADFLELPYDVLEEKNLEMLKDSETKTPDVLEKEYRAYLKKEKAIKAVTLCFSDIEGRFRMLDYDKNFLLDSAANLTFDGSSIRGFSELGDSDLRLEIDWSTLRLVPADVFGAGKVIMFASVLDKERKPYQSDFRAQLKLYADKLKKQKGITANMAAEVEGFLVDGHDAEQVFKEEKGFSLISSGGYFHSLPLDVLKKFIDKSAEVQRAMAFKNEKDHPEVAPSQFELNFSYTSVLRACDNIQLYKLICRQVAESFGLTATFLPKPIADINGSGMHLNISLSKGGKNIFYDPKGVDGLSKIAWEGILRVLNHAPEICLMLNSSVNSYRRLDPNFEAPNQIKISSCDRSSMIRIPAGNEKTARVEIRSVAPDANPYMALFVLLKTMLEGEKLKKDEGKRDRVRFLPGNIYDAIRLYKSSDFMTEVLGEEPKEKYLALKQAAADRSPKELGGLVKNGEIIYHHEVTNQVLWNRF